MNPTLAALMGRLYQAPPEDGIAPPAAASTPPVATPVTAPDPGAAPQDTPGEPGISEKDMTALLDDTDIDSGQLKERGTSPVEPPSPKPTTPVPPVVPPVAAPSSVVPPVAPPIPPVVTPAAVAPVAVAPEAPSVTQPVVPVKTPEVVAQEQTVRRQEYVKQVQGSYAISEKDAIDFNANPAAKLPEIAAKLHVDVLESAVHGVMMQMPQVVEAFLLRREATQKAENAFYESWPMLDRNNAAHKATVNSLMAAIVQRNPNITRADATKQAGAAALVALGIPYTAQAAAAIPAVPQPAVIAQPPGAGFQPMAPGVGGSGLPGVQSQDANPFTALSREFEEDI